MSPGIGMGPTVGLTAQRRAASPDRFVILIAMNRSGSGISGDRPDTEDVDENHIECQSVYNVEPAYSEWLIEELRDEWRVQFPMINKLFEAIQNNGKTNIERYELLLSFQKVGINPSDSEMLQYLRFLFDNSIVGFRVGRSNQWRFKCFSPSQGFIESELYKIHDGLHRGLNLMESRSNAQV